MPGALARFLRERKDVILDDWLNRVSQLASARNLEPPALRDHVPRLLDRIGPLSEDIAAHGSGPFPTELAARHGVERLAGGFDLAEVMLEYSLLRGCLLRAWGESAEHPGHAGYSALSGAVDVYASASVASYTQARDRTLEAVDRVSAAALESRGLEELLTRILRAFVQTDPAVATAMILLRDGAVLRGRAAEGIDSDAVRGLKVDVADVCGEGVPTPGRSARLQIAAADELVKGCVPGIRALHAVPLVEGGALIGAAHLGSSSAFEFSDQDVHLFRAVASRATTAIVQQLLRQDADRRTAELEAVIESLPAAIYIGDEGGITRSNRMGLELLGLEDPADLAEPVERRARRLDPRNPTTGESIPAAELPFPRALRGISSSIDMLVRHQGTGEELFVHAVAAPIREGDRIVGGVAVNHDVTEYMRTLERLRIGEERLLLAQDVAKIGAWDWDVARDALVWTARWREIHGVGADETASLERFLACVHPEDRPAVLRALGDASRQDGDREFDLEYRVVLPDAEVRWTAARGRTFFEPGAEGPRAVRTIGTAVDVTARRRQHEDQRLLSEAGSALVATLDHRETLARIAKLAVPRLADWCAVEVVVDGKTEQLAVEHVDPSKVELARMLRERYGTSPDATRGVLQVLRSGVAELYERIPEELIRESAQDPEHAEMLRKLGFRSAMIVPMIARGRTVGALSFVTAESGRRYTSQDLAVAEQLAGRAGLAIDNARLFHDSEMAVRARDQILAIVSHDLRGPLGTVVMSAALMLQSESGGNPSARKQIDVIQRSARRMEHLIDDLLDMASIQSGRLSVKLEHHNVDVILREAVEAMDSKARESGIQLRADSRLEGVRLVCDRDRLHQAIGNLLSNSMKFCRGGDSVTLRGESVESEVRIVVEDTGPGIKPEHLAHVLERYWSGASDGKRSTGLGLFITKGIVEAHGGRIAVRSEVGAGTRVELVLPRVQERK